MRDPKQRPRVLTVAYWAFVAGVTLPLFLSVAYTTVVVSGLNQRAKDGDLGVSPAYPVVMGLALGVPPLLLVGAILSLLLRRPRAPLPRFVLGFAIGATLFLIGQGDVIKF